MVWSEGGKRERTFLNKREREREFEERKELLKQVKESEVCGK